MNGLFWGPPSIADVICASPQLANLRRRKLGDVICDNSGIPATLEKILRADSGFQACDYRRRDNTIQFDLFA